MSTSDTPETKGKRTRRQARRLYHTLVLLGTGIVLALLFALVQPFYDVNLWLTDQLFTPEAPSPNIVIAGIDDATLAAYGKWSEWPRSLHAQAIDHLSEAGAKVIGFDIASVTYLPSGSGWASSTALIIPVFSV